jgi:two-component system nitrate/nitrite sensor histidine kinase NarX
MEETRVRLRDRGDSGLSGEFTRLRWLGVVLPVAFVVALEIARALFVEPDSAQLSGHLVLALTTVAGVLVFATVMFWLIDRAQRHVVRQNRELAAVNAVSTAVQGELGVEVIIDAALASVIESTGATEASVTVFSADDHQGDEGGLERRRVVADHELPTSAGRDGVPHLIDIPLSTGTTVVGRMRLHLPSSATEPNLLASAALENIGHQLASAIQMGQLVADLNRRKNEGHGLYDILLRISNQEALADTLAAVAVHARALAHGDEASVCVTESTALDVHLNGSLAGATTLADGAVCIGIARTAASDLDGEALPRAGHAPAPIPFRTEVPIVAPHGMLGELWVGRYTEPFSERDRRFLMTLAGLASIAITSARMRENERQGAIVAERDRIAREMHDSLAQILGVTHLRLRAVEAWPEVSGSPRITAELADLAVLTEEAYRDVREAILGLRESARVDRGLIESLRAYLEKYSHQSGVKTRLETSLDVEPSLAPGTEIQLIRVIQEALTNVRKHSGASSAIVRMSNGGEAVTIVVEDDGHGFDLTGTLLGRDGYGLHTMRERMELIGGTLTIDSSPGNGTRITASLPGPSHPTPPLRAPAEATS